MTSSATFGWLQIALVLPAAPLPTSATSASGKKFSIISENATVSNFKIDRHLALNSFYITTKNDNAKPATSDRQQIE